MKLPHSCPRSAVHALELRRCARGFTAASVGREGIVRRRSMASSSSHPDGPCAGSPSPLVPQSIRRFR